MRWLLVAVVVLGACGRSGFDLLRNDASTGDDADGGDGGLLVVPGIVQPPASCSNGVMDGYETATDCGGLCERCEACATKSAPTSTCLCGIEWLTPWPAGKEFSAVYAASETSAILAGSGGYVLAWDGTQFASGFVGNGDIEAASGTGPDDVWLAGSQVWHWDGAAWALSMPPNVSSILSIHARAPDDVWAVGRNGGVHHYDGTAWTTNIPSAGAFMTSVWAMGANDVWIGELDGTLSRWNGTALTPIAGAAFDRVDYIWSTGPSEVYLIATPTGMGNTLVRWNGSTFTAVGTGIAFGLEAISGTGPNDVWVLGPTEVSHWNGATWTRTSFPAGYQNSEALTTSGRAELAVAGNRVFIADDGKRLLLDNSVWRPAGPTGESFTGVWSDAVTTHAMGPNTWLHGTGANLVRDPPPATNAAGVFGFAANDLWTTANGNAYQYDGATWTLRGAAGGAFTGTSSNDLWILPPASPATARHWTGAAFANVAMPADFRPNDGWALSTTDVWVAGRKTSTGGPSIARWNGTTWSLLTPPPATNELLQVWASSATDVWVASYALNGNVWHYDGTGWTDRSGAGSTLYATAVRGGPAGVFVWAQQRLSRWNGSGWDLITGSSGVCPDSSSVTMTVAAGEVWIAGRFGVLGRYRP